MAGIQISDVLRLARSDLEDASGQLDKMFDWRYDRATTTAKAMVGLGASIFLAVLAAVYQHNSKSSWTPVYWGAGGAAAVLVFGMIMYGRLRRIYREYVVAHELLASALRVRPFLKLVDPDD